MIDRVQHPGGAPAGLAPAAARSRLPGALFSRVFVQTHSTKVQPAVPTAYITHPSSMLHDMGPYHPECPARIAAIGDRLISSGLDAYLHHHTAPAATREQLARAHGSDYIASIDAASPASGLHYLDPDTALCPHSLEAARHAAGAVVLATDLVLTGKASTAFCAVRPPGHHAERGRAMGFCLFNNVAVGALHAIEQHGLERVAIIDFDVHHGNGTEDIFDDDPRVLMVSTFQHPLYPYSGTDNPSPNMVNVPLPAGSGSDAFRQAVVDHWLPALEAHSPQLLYISAGFDAHREDPLAGLKLTEADYAWVTRELLGVAKVHGRGRIVSTLEGGYALSALGRSVTEHIREMIAG
jgi:acetoin utilization deacetylase AcuC-like enzyme